jgi:sec-independent protein translocase protein TatA
MPRTEEADMGGVKPWHIIVLAVVLVLLFGAKRLPDAARSLGRSLRIIKAETRGLAEDDVAAKAEAQSGRAPLTVSDDQPSAAPVVDPVTRTRDN